MAKVTIDQCDRCDEVAQGSWEVLTPTGVIVALDLCKLHAESLTELVPSGRRITQRRTPMSRHESRRIAAQPKKPA